MERNKKFSDISAADLLEWEDEICSSLKKHISFTSCTLYFPNRRSICNPILLENEMLLLLPLYLNGEAQAMLKLEGVNCLQIQRYMPLLPGMATLILEKLRFSKLLNIDWRSGLATEESIFRRTEDEIEKARMPALDYRPGEKSAMAWHHLCKAFVILRWQDAKSVIRKYDWDFHTKVFNEISAILKKDLPHNTLAGPIGRFEGMYDIGIIVNTLSGRTVTDLLKAILKKIDAVCMRDPLSKALYKPAFFAGYALYPQDMQGELLAGPVFEQILALKKKAQLAADFAFKLNMEGQPVRILSYAGIAAKAGRITEILTPSRVKINLGLNTNIKTGMRFFIMDKGLSPDQSVPKGQLLILEAARNYALCEIFYLNSPANLPSPGDRLVKTGHFAEDGLTEEESVLAENKPDFILSHAEFSYNYRKATEEKIDFILAIIKIRPDEKSDMERGGEYDIYNILIPPETDSDLLIGFYNDDRIIAAFFGQTLDEAKGWLQACALRAKEQKLNFACGVALYPYLDHTVQDIEGNALKALEYAELLPEPHIGVFDSLAQTISADKKYSMGDTLGAIEEYRRALLADERNSLARNSLAVCLASLGRADEAKKNLYQALDYSADRLLNARIAYNLGTIFQTAKETEKAAHWYRQCLRHNRKNPYAWIRMAGINELKGRINSAKRYYLCALRIAGEDGEITNMVERQLARLALLHESAKEARQKLHDNLLRNPQDTLSMELLGSIYLTECNDPALAEMLARKSIRIADSGSAWNLLADALEKQGHNMAAMQARARASGRS